MAVSEVETGRLSAAPFQPSELVVAASRSLGG